MISIAKINSFLQRWANTAEGKERIKAFVIKARLSGKPTASGETLVGDREMRAMAADFISILQQNMPAQLEGAASTLDYSNVRQINDGYLEIVISFDPDALHKESLYDEGYPKGLENIVALFNNGYHAKNYVYGWWEGHSPTGTALERSSSDDGDFAWVRSRKEREPLNFIQDTVAEFNARYGTKYGATVEVGSDYKG